MGAELTYLALGDSYTIGEGVAATDRWPRLLAKRLRASGVNLKDPRIIATTGWTTDELSAAMDAAEPLGEWDFVSLLIGVNNQYRGRSVENFRAEFSQLLKRALRLARGRRDRLLVLSIPDWGITPFAAGRNREQIALELDRFNTAQAEICAQLEVAYVDIAPISRARGAATQMLARDGLHPSGAMYALWTAQALPQALSLLDPKPD
jgi:lysophospholipase L1-like esterase